MSVPLVALLMFALLLLAMVNAVAVSLGPVPRHRVERFARRQSLQITPDNGNLVIAYLATTRRWRAAGLVAGTLAPVLLGAAAGPSLNFLHLLAGWFAGAVVAEWRISRIPAGALRAASLQPRLPQIYVSTAARLFPLVVSCLTVAVVAVSVVVPSSPRTTLFIQTAIYAAIAVGLVVVGRLVQRRILDRPQPLAAKDVLAADDAIRSRSLRVLVGAIGTLVSYCLSAQLFLLSHMSPGSGTLIGFANAAGIVGLVGTGFGRAMGSSPWSVHRATAQPHAA